MENKKEKTEQKEVHTSKKPRRNKKLVEGYKRRNRLVEVVIVCVLLVVLFVLGCNKTFLKNEYTQKNGNSNIVIELPRFTYFVGSDNNKIVFRTLRKSTNIRAFFDDFLNSEGFDKYFCSGVVTPYYYNREGKYFIYNIEIKKNLGIKTVTVNYSTVDYDLFCNTINRDDEEITELPEDNSESGVVNEGV